MWILAATIHYSKIAKLVEDCYNESDIDNKVHIHFKINSFLPKSYCIDMTSLITDDCIDTVYMDREKYTSITNNLCWIVAMEPSVLIGSNGDRRG
jgi:hypothetical protein